MLLYFFDYQKIYGLVWFLWFVKNPKFETKPINFEHF